MRAETVRLAAAVLAQGVDVSALVWNRVTINPQPLPEMRATRQYFAQEVAPPPIGVAALRRWLRSWKGAITDSFPV